MGNPPRNSCFEIMTPAGKMFHVGPDNTDMKNAWFS